MDITGAIAETVRDMCNNPTIIISPILVSTLALNSILLQGTIIMRVFQETTPSTINKKEDVNAEIWRDIQREIGSLFIISFLLLTYISVLGIVVYDLFF